MAAQVLVANGVAIERHFLSNTLHQIMTMSVLNEPVETLPAPEINDVSMDVMKHVLSFCGHREESAVYAVSSHFNTIAKHIKLDAVDHVAWVELVDGESRFHIKRISSVEKYAMNKDLTSMTATADRKKYFMLSSKDNKGQSSFKWSQFVACSLRRISKRDCSGYWNILSTDDKQRRMIPNNSAPVVDLTLLRSLVTHPALDMVAIRTGQHTVKVYLHGADISSDREYEIIYSNQIGSVGLIRPERCTAFQLRRGESDETEYYLYCNTAPRRVEWQWYDNNSATYKTYGAGPEVDAQLEVSFQANLHFPASIGHHFSNVNFNALTNAVAAESGQYSRRRSKQFLLRFRFAEAVDGVHREIVSAEQITVHPRPYCTFPRVIQRKERARDNAEEYLDCSDRSECRERM